jgi:hypothetical protein
MVTDIGIPSACCDSLRRSQTELPDPVYEFRFIAAVAHPFCANRLVNDCHRLREVAIRRHGPTKAGEEPWLGPKMPPVSY